MCMQGLMKFHPILLKILIKQNVTDGRTDGRMDGRTDGRKDNVKTVYPPTNTVCRGIYIILCELKCPVGYEWCNIF